MKLVKPVSVCETHVLYNDRILILKGELNYLCINSFRWENGEELSIDEKIDVMKHLTVKENRSDLVKLFASFPLSFFDAGGIGFGEGIFFDKDNNPIVEVVDGNIKSNRIKCECETNFPQNSLIERKDFKEFRKKISDAPLFKLKRKNFTGSEIEFECTRCNNIWELRKPCYAGNCTWKCHFKDIYIELD